MPRAPIVVEPGQALGTRRLGPITQTDIVRFAGAGGDFNPLHHDEAYARKAGLPGVIAMGQMQAGMLAAWVADMVGVEHLLAYSVRFASPLAIGEVVDMTGAVETVVDGIADLTLTATASDRLVISGTARIRVTQSG